MTFFRIARIVCFLTCVVFCPFANARVNEVSILPPNPEPGEEVFLHVVWSGFVGIDPSAPFTTVTRSGSQVTVDIVEIPGFIIPGFPPGPFNGNIPLGTFARGDYQVAVRVEVDQDPVDQFFNLGFSVGPQPVSAVSATGLLVLTFLVALLGGFSRQLRGRKL